MYLRLAGGDVRGPFFLGAFFSIVSAMPAMASPLTVNFCPYSASCPTGVMEASLTFTEIVNSDPNDYILDVVIKGDGTAPRYVDELSFAIDGFQTPGAFEIKPVLLASPGDGVPWNVYWDNISAGAGSCDGDTGHSQSVCAQSGPKDAANFGAVLPGQTLTWEFLVDLSGSAALSDTSFVNLRAQFLDSIGNNVGILSPGGASFTPVPEPATLVLCTTGFAALAASRRRRAFAPLDRTARSNM